MQRYTIVSKKPSNKILLFGRCELLCGGLAQVYSTVFQYILKRSSKQHSVLIIQVKCVVPKDIHVISSQHLNIKKICDGLNPRHPMIEGTHAFVVCFVSSRGWVVDPTVGAAVPLNLFMAQLDNCTDNDIDFEWFDLGSVGSDSAIYQYYTSEFFLQSLSAFHVRNTTDSILDKVIKFKLFLGF